MAEADLYGLLKVPALAFFSADRNLLISRTLRVSKTARVYGDAPELIRLASVKRIALPDPLPAI
jgi:hypothetical protein